MLYKTLFKSFNKITTTEKQRDKEQIPKGRRKLEIILVRYDILCNILKWKTIKNNIQTTKGDKRIEIEMVTYFLSWW